MNYNFKDIEKKWQKKWDTNLETYEKKPTNGKLYCLPMFPYPSGAGLHVGHWRSYVLADIYARTKWLQGYNVLHPMGWDAFGLPAENDAIKKGIHPAESTAKNIAHFKKQLKELGGLYNWDKELNTTDPEYYKWTQWIFLKLYKAGLAYETNAPINWCPSCLTGLANEEVIDGKCERCGSQTEQKKIRQWILKITAYAEKLLEGLKKLEWPQKVKLMQEHWIGKSKGLIFYNTVKNSDLVLETFSAHFEAFTADTFIVIAPDHPLLEKLLHQVKNKEEILKFCDYLIQKRSTVEGPLIEGIFTGKFAVDPYSNRDMPIWVAGFAIAQYGTGIIRCSAHDQRDFDFAKKYNIALKITLVPQNPKEIKSIENFEYCYSNMEEGILTEPTEFAGKNALSCRKEIIEYCVAKKYARKHISYKLRDWIFSRQRYWGEPIPLIHCPKCGIVPVPESELPVKLPDVKNYQPSGTGESPLATIPEFVNTTCPNCRSDAKRETNTMPQWAGSCWYFLRYPNPHNKKEAWSKEDINYWLPVDLYVGGIEHAILHLLYARFWVKVLFDQNLLPFDEPFLKLFNQGMVLKLSEKSGLVEKMSKSRGNVVNPEEIIEKYGSDVLRMYILFMGPPELDCQWQDSGIEGISRFVNRFYNYFINSENHLNEEHGEQKIVTQAVHHFIDQFHTRMEHFKPNTAISACMEFLNMAEEKKMKLSNWSIEAILSLFSIVAPHIASELLEKLLNKKLADCSYPKANPEFLVKDTVTIVIQINGKLRDSIEVLVNEKMEYIIQQAKIKVEKWLLGKKIIKTISVPHKLINFVVQ